MDYKELSNTIKHELHKLEQISNLLEAYDRQMIQPERFCIQVKHLLEQEAKHES